MTSTEIKKNYEEMLSSWEQYKKVNNERLSQLEKKATADPLFEVQLLKINNSIEEQKKKMNQLEASFSRPKIIDTKSLNSENTEYKSAFMDYVKKGIDVNLANYEKKSGLVSMTTDGAYGGYLVLPNIQRLIIDRVTELCIMRKICSVQEISTSSLDVIDNTAFSTSWIAENGTVSDTNAGTINKKTIATYDLIAQPKVSQKLLDDSAIDFEQWLSYQISQDFAKAEETAFIKGEGSTSNQPTGILSYSNGTTSSTIEKKTSSQTTTFFNENDIIDLYYSLKDEYVKNASFLMSRSAVQEIRKLKDPVSGAYLWNPALLGGKEDTLLGCPVYQSDIMDSINTSKEPIILGDFKYYQIVDRLGVRILRDPFTAKPFIRFYTTKRVGGDVIRTEAFKVLKCSAYNPS